jgi:thymidine kinase
MDNYPGKLIGITGPMFAGKTTEFIRLYDRQTYITNNIFIANSARDTRYDDPKANVKTHKKVTLESTPIENLGDIPIETLIAYDAFFIDECQFIELSVSTKSVYYQSMVAINSKAALDAVYMERCYIPKFLTNIGRTVILCYLHLTYNNQLFKHENVETKESRTADIYYLCPSFCTEYHLLTGICTACKRNDSQYTIVKKGTDITGNATGANVGGSEKYASVCNVCRLKLM